MKPSRLGTLIGVLFLVFAVLVGILGACTPVSEESPPVVETPNFPLTVTDQAGRLVTIEKMPEKIISLAPSNTEIVFALGLGNKLVGVTEYCNYPEAAKDKPKIGDIISVDIEKIIEIQPDLILAADFHMTEVVPQLEALGLTVLVLGPTTVEEVLEAITLVGKCAGKEDAASQLVTEMRDRIKAVTDEMANLTGAQRPRVLYITWHDPLFAVGSETLSHELIVEAGGINVAQELIGPSMMSLETVILANPEIIMADLGMGVGDLILQFALIDERLEGIDARINNRVYGIDTDLIRPGPRIVDGLEFMAGLIHPEIFPELFEKYFGSD